MAEPKDYGFRAFVVSVVTGALLLVMTGITMTMLLGRHNKDRLVYAFDSTWKIAKTVFDKHIEYVPHRQMESYYWRARKYYDDECRSLYGTGTLENWEKKNVSNITSIKKVDAIKRAMTPIAPVDSARITSVWGYRRHPLAKQMGGQPVGMHTGIDIALKKGDSVYAIADGVVKRIWKSNGHYGKSVLLTHADGFESLYAHLDWVFVSKGETVKRGDIIAKGGNTGRSTGYHLHLETRIDGEAWNPLLFINY